MRINAVAVVCVTLILCTGMARAAEMPVAGIVKSVKGRAVISRHGQSLEAAGGMKIFMGDVVQTAEGGSIGLVFNDDTLVSMGPNSEMVIADYDFAPIEGQLSFVARLIRGTIAYLSGQIAKLSPESVRLETPVATIGVRGTQVLVKLEQ